MLGVSHALHWQLAKPLPEIGALNMCSGWLPYTAACFYAQAQVDEAVAAMKQRKAANVGNKGSAAALSVEDYASEGLRLRTAMARAVEKEE
jgi:hypothetical protein